MSIDTDNRKINFAGKFKIFGIVSVVLVVLSLVLFFSMGLNYGVDFAGGTEMQIRAEGLKTDGLRAILEPFGQVDIQNFEGKDDEFLLRFKNISMVKDEDINAFLASVKGAFTDTEIIREHFDSQVGDRIEVWFDKEVDQEKIKSLVSEYKVPATGTIEYRQVGERHIYRIMLQGLTNTILSTIKETSGSEPELLRVELVGPKVGERLRYSAAQAVLYALMAILIYIAFRFNIHFAPGAVAALTHDVFITLGIWSLLGLQFDLTIVAALLTIVGYSLNDTIVIYDRIRENWNNHKKGSNVIEKINTSINETLSRTLLTSITTLFVLLALLFFGGGTIGGFALAMTIGVLVGTYSSIFVAAPVTIFVEKLMRRETT
ncbi:MAG TPA: protein translocase subunit SecF [bacterium]|nr:protein translocase subunit SecF [bacterium]